MTHSNLKTERHRLQDILANVFCLHQKSHRKNDGKWANENPLNTCETNDRNDVKVMIFVVIINEIVPIVHAFLDYDCYLQSVNGISDLRLLQDIILDCYRT